MVLNGIYPIAYRLILPLVPMAFMAEAFYRLCGCRLGKGVRVTTVLIFDPYLVEIGDRSTVGLRARETRRLERWRIGPKRPTEGVHEFPAHP